MKGKSILFNNSNLKTRLRHFLNLQLFAEKRVSDKGIAIQSTIDDIKLKNLVGELYREGSTFGDGSAMSAASEQIRTGMLVGGKDHVIKIRERITNLSRIISNQNLSEKDLRYANRLLEEMKKALKGEY